MTLPIANVVLPHSLIGQANGNLDPSLLVNIHPSGKLHVLAARAFKAFVDACGKQGIPLTFTYGGCYRTYPQQEALFRQRYTTTPLSGTSRKFWQGMWWYLKPGLAMAAVPGTSNHGLGLAIDTALDSDPKDGLGPDDAVAITLSPKFIWFRDNAIRFGFSFESQSEPWHIRYVAGDAIPQAVLDFEHGVLNPPTPTPLPPFDPAKGQWGLYPIANKPVAKYGDRGDYIKYLQGVAELKAGQTAIGPIDGAFGHQTELGVKNIQAFFKLVPNGIVDAATWKVIDFLATK
jgi:hypothetical protein